MAEKGLMGLLPLVVMVLVQVGYAGMNVIAKVAMNAGMQPLVLVAYRQIFATVALAPLAFYLERNTRPKITIPLLVNIFWCSLTGVTGNQVLYFIGLQLSTPTIGCALSNTLPALTFVLAVLFRQESVGIKRISGQAKVMGTICCVGGAMVLSFYHGHIIKIPESGIHVIDSAAGGAGASSSAASTAMSFLGPLLIIGSALSWALWFVLQARVSESFPAPYSCSWLMCFMGSIQCVLIAAGPNHHVAQWSLANPGALSAALYSGVVCSALGFSLTAWSIQKRGALYVSVFTPLLLVVVAVLSWAFLGEKLFMGTLIGSVFIIGGLYAVLWGKDMEEKLVAVAPLGEVDKHGDPVSTMVFNKEEQDVELQLPAAAGGGGGDGRAAGVA
ncbi:unnamed protein product [Linum tenue]|uniref:WAT1-related protein n=1 Tax=Linum tenue TaxID=586396 RepID=A0AAV0NLT7_9ROSI|nr:unnamed protein product [Linum tenue]CAI0459562.1 unnamed protein product [Linum tenue]